MECPAGPHPHRGLCSAAISFLTNVYFLPCLKKKIQLLFSSNFILENRKFPCVPCQVSNPISGPGAYLAYQSKCWPAGSPCPPQSLTGHSRGCHTPPPILHVSSPGARLPIPQLLSPIQSSHFGYPSSFGPIGCCTWFPSFPLPSFPALLTGLRVVCTLDSQTSLPQAMLSHTPVINFLLHHIQGQLCFLPF